MSRVWRDDKLNISYFRCQQIFFKRLLVVFGFSERSKLNHTFQGTIGCTPKSVPMVFIVFSRDSWGL